MSDMEKKKEKQNPFPSKLFQGRAQYFTCCVLLKTKTPLFAFDSWKNNHLDEREKEELKGTSNKRSGGNELRCLWKKKKGNERRSLLCCVFGFP